MTNTLYVVVGVSDGCNLDCAYCFRDAVGVGPPMGDDTLGNLIRKLLDHDGLRRVIFIWHGGEPTLPGVQFYRRVIELQQLHRGSKQIENQMQTNGVISDPKLLDFLLEYDYHLGISLDGPKDLHDVVRPYRSDGAGSFDDVMRTIEALERKRVPVGLISVVTQLSLPRTAELYRFLTGVAGSVKFRPMNWVGAGARTRDRLGITASEYAQFLSELFPLWLNDPRQKRVNPFADALDDMVSGEPQHCSSVSSCAKYYISVSANGDVYSCSGFAGNPKHYYGNINREELESILTSPRRQRLIHVRQDVADCSSCEYRPICNSGCMLSTYMVDGAIDHRDYWCAAHKAVFGLIKDALANRLGFQEERHGST